MSRMANPEGHPSSAGSARAVRSRRKRNVVAKAGAADSEFVRAFADALQDILRHERRVAA